eukprot:COSAG02_NODE_3988_length_5945_cov_2.580226_3_plen_108_part_00
MRFVLLLIDGAWPLVCVCFTLQLFPNDIWDDTLWMDFRAQYNVDPTAPGLNQEQFSHFRQVMSIQEQKRRDTFAQFDEDGDGFLNQAEMEATAAALYPVSLLSAINI